MPWGSSSRSNAFIGSPASPQAGLAHPNTILLKPTPVQHARAGRRDRRHPYRTRAIEPSLLLRRAAAWSPSSTQPIGIMGAWHATGTQQRMNSRAQGLSVCMGEIKIVQRNRSGDPRISGCSAAHPQRSIYPTLDCLTPIIFGMACRSASANASNTRFASARHSLKSTALRLSDSPMGHPTVSKPVPSHSRETFATILGLFERF